MIYGSLEYIAVNENDLRAAREEYRHARTVGREPFIKPSLITSYQNTKFLQRLSDKILEGPPILLHHLAKYHLTLINVMDVSKTKRLFSV